MRHYILVSLLAWATVARTRLFSESISARGLLGSHFGVPGLAGTYDYIVIGGGTAGLTIARRLAANTSITVAVIEAGDFYEFSNGNLSEIPAFATDFTGNNPTQKNPYLDWYQYTEPQSVSRYLLPELVRPSKPCNRTEKFCHRLLVVRGSYTTLAKCSEEPVGETFCGRYGQYSYRQEASQMMRSAFIACTLIGKSGTRGAFDKWAEQVGDESYRFNNILPYFQRSAKFTPPDATQRLQNSTAQYNVSDWSPTGGPVQVGYSSWVNPVSSWLGLAFKELGLNELPSLLSGALIGWSWLSVELDPVTQTRSSSSAFLREALKDTTNLVVYKSTLAKKIWFENGSAAGVIVDSGGVTYNISARREVVLSAGVVRPVHLLGHTQKADCSMS